jgi:hypothetical protein
MPQHYTLQPMDFRKENFLRSQLVTYLQKLDPATAPRWGRMNVQQMIEHFTDAVMIASGKLKLPAVIEGEQLHKYREFMMSEKPFRPNTVNPLMGEEPPPLKCNTVQAAIGKLKEELIYFFETFEKNPGLITHNPFFGPLNFEQNIHLLYKHALHHLQQFGVDVSG